MATVTVTTPPAVPALTLANAKLHLRVDHTEEDGFITALINSATEYLERVYDKAFIDQSITMTVDGFPASNGVLKLRRGPIKTGTLAISYLDTLGAPTAFTDFQVDLISEPPRLAPAVNFDWPDTQIGALAAVTITYDAGLGAADTDIPERYQQAIKLLIGHWYTNRESVVVGTISSKVEQTLEFLLWNDRVFDFAKAG